MSQLQLQSDDSEFAVPTITPDKVSTKSVKIVISSPVQQLIGLIHSLEEIITECPPDTGPRRFGNVAFKSWHKLVEERVPELLEKYLPPEIVSPEVTVSGVSAKQELTSYLMGSFGSAQRLDYGTGHELSFLAFLCGLWLLGGFEVGRDEQSIVLHILATYLNLICKLVKIYTLEPAGSHGVWGLDDHSFLPYIFGSAQLTTQALSPGVEPDYATFRIPRPSDVSNRNIVEQWRDKNLYFGAVGFIYDVKKGPFWEHSSILFNLSGVIEGWGKINIVRVNLLLVFADRTDCISAIDKGMIKMFKAEVLGRFPVVQHFHFGSLFPWTTTVEHSKNTTSPSVVPTDISRAQVIIRAPWGKPSSVSQGVQDLHPKEALATTRAPWAREPRVPSPHLPVPSITKSSATADAPITKAPWIRESRVLSSQASEPQVKSPVKTDGPMTRAPWAK